MKWSRSSLLLLASILTFLLLIGLLHRRGTEKASAASGKIPSAIPTEKTDASTTPKRSAATFEATSTAASRDLLAALRRMLGRRDARPQEAVIALKDNDAYQRFLARARQAGLTVLDRIDGLRTVRVRYDSLESLQRDLTANASDYTDVGANFLVNIPQVPSKENRAAVEQVPFGNRALEFLGVNGDHSQWGRGVTIAIIDSGIASDATFGQGRLKAIDIGFGITPGTDSEGGHGTSVASLAAGLSPDAPGVSPAANLLSLRVTDATGASDIFTVSRAILAAVDAGAKIINVSLGGYGTTSTLDAAIGYATEHGALIVAAAGNDQAAQLTWPAADSRVVSVGAVDAAGQQVLFSNSGPQLQMTAPGYAVQTAWLDNQRVSVSGTSASAPLVSGAIAAIMSENPGYTAQQAWEVLQKTASDAGAPGDDPNYGNGVLNLGWAMNRNNASYVDTAVASHYYDAANNQMEFVVQNRSARAVGGLQLNVAVNGVTSPYAVSMLDAGGSTVIKVNIDQNALRSTGSLTFVTQLVNPLGVADQVPANNRKSSTLTPAK